MKYFIFFIIFMVGCQTAVVQDNSGLTNKPVEELNDVIFNTKLKDVSSNTEFTINDYKGKKVLLETFAVWCPTCKRQQDVLRELHNELDVVSISLDTDPNEDESAVLNHMNQNEFDWHFVVSPVEFTKELINIYGVNVVNAPSTPVILICENQETRFLTNGFKSLDKLKEEISKGC